MSHETKIETDFRDPETLKKAALALGCTVEEGSGFYQGYSEDIYPCDWKIIVPGSRHEVGVTVQEDGSLSIATDWYSSRYYHENTTAKNLEILGEDFDLLKTEYNVQHTMDTVMWDGWTLESNEEVQLCAS